MATEKPSKPRKDFPLFPHDAGVWAKKIRGKLHYFGPWSDPQGALKRYREQFPYLQAGKKPPGQEVTIANLLDAFLGDKHGRLISEEISQTTYNEYEAACDAIAEALDKNMPAAMLHPLDVATLRLKLSRGKKGQAYSPATIKRRLTIARMLFAFGNETMGLSVQYKRPLAAPAKRLLRQRKRERGKLLYSAPDIRKLVKAADPHLKAMLLLGINCGFGPKDCCSLPSYAVDLAAGWHNYHRPKTEVERRCPLWPETVKALKAIHSDRHVFNGRIWTRHIVAREFVKLCKVAGVKNYGFYSLRRTFETIATTARVSQAVIDHIMGHSRNDMANTYRQEIFDSQLLECSNHVRGWYLGKVTV